MRTLSIGKLIYDTNIIVDKFPSEGINTSAKELINCSSGSTCVVSYALAKWNEESFVSGVVGYDEVGNSMRKDMENNKVLVPYLETNYEIKTPTNYVLVNNENKSKTPINYQASNYNIKKYEYDQPMDCVVADGYEYNASVYAYNKYAKGITILNAKTPRQSLLDFFKYAKYIIASENVAEAMTGLKIDFSNPITMSNIYKKITDKYPNINLIIVMPNKGVIYQLNGSIKVLSDIKTENINNTDTHDMFVAGVSYGLTNHYDLETTIRFATIAAHLAKNTLGETTSIPLLSDIISFYESKFGKLNRSIATPEEKVENAPTTK